MNTSVIWMTGKTKTTMNRFRHNKEWNKTKQQNNTIINRQTQYAQVVFFFIFFLLLFIIVHSGYVCLVANILRDIQMFQYTSNKNGKKNVNMMWWWWVLKFLFLQWVININNNIYVNDHESNLIHSFMIIIEWKDFLKRIKISSIDNGC